MSWDQHTALLREKKFWISIKYVWALLLRPCESSEQSIFPWQIMFTSKFKNTHPHLEEMPSRFLCDLSGHICGQYCLACGQLSFYCFISASVSRNNGSGPRPPVHTWTHIHCICLQTWKLWTCIYSLFATMHTKHTKLTNKYKQNKI